MEWFAKQINVLVASITSLVVVLTPTYLWIKGKVKEWTPILEPVIQLAEQQAIDGIIDPEERKALVMKLVAEMEEHGKLKLNFITRWIIGKVIDSIAKKLPPFVLKKLT
jgi:hypothetical protein